MNEESNPLVTVIIAFLNEERFLSEAIESVINQTFDNWELLLVDDGSCDKSTEIAKGYMRRFDGKIRYTEHVQHANKGVSISRNIGINQARGKYVAFLDADDVWFHCKLKRQVEIITNYPNAEMVCEASEYWYFDEGQHLKPNRIKPLGNLNDRVFLPPFLAETLYPLADGQAPAPSGILVTKNAALKHGGFEADFTGKYQLYEDQTFLIKLYLNEPIYISSQSNHKYRQREDSCVRRTKNDGDYHVVRQYFLEWLEQYLKQNNFKQKRIKQLLNDALEPYRFPTKYFVKRFIARIRNAVSRRLAITKPGNTNN